MNVSTDNDGTLDIIIINTAPTYLIYFNQDFPASMVDMFGHRIGHQKLSTHEHAVRYLALSSIAPNYFNTFKPEFTIVIFIHYKARIAAAFLDL